MVGGPIWAHCSRNMGNIFFSPIHACYAPRGGLAPLDLLRWVTTPPTGILPDGAGAATRDVTIPLAAVRSGNLSVFPDAGILPFDSNFWAGAKVEGQPQAMGPLLSDHQDPSYASMGFIFAFTSFRISALSHSSLFFLSFSLFLSTSCQSPDTNVVWLLVVLT